MSTCNQPNCGAPASGTRAKWCLQHAAERRRKPCIYHPTPEGDRLIRHAYDQFRLENDRCAIGLAARRLQWSKWRVTHRARELGLARTKEAPWSERETAILEQWGWMSPERLVLKLKKAGYVRTATAIEMKRKRLQLTVNGNWYSGRQLAEALGVDDHKVGRWIRSGLLKAGRRGTVRTEQQGGDTYLILRANVKAFVLRCPEEYDLGKVEKYWFLDLITDGRICR